MDAEEALERLLEGNKRFMAGELAPVDVKGRRESSMSGQKPMATVVCCSDSRVVPELIFNTNLEDIFTIITAGNVVDGVAVGSIEYGVGHLHTPVLIVMGHEKCGAVTAAYDGHREASITTIMEKIEPAAAKVKRGGDKGAEVEEAVVENVKNVIEDIKKSPIVGKALEEGRLKIVAAKYHFKDGSVEILG